MEKDSGPAEENEFPQAAAEENPSEMRRDPQADSEALFRAAMGDEGVKARILGELLNATRVPLMGGSGIGVVAPSDRPKTIAEAGKLALGYLKKNQ